MKKGNMDFYRKSTIQVTCEKGLVPWLEDELKGANEKIIRKHKTGLELEGTLIDCIRLNLFTRTAYSVLYLLRGFKANTPDELYNEAKKIPWHGIIPNDSYFSITTNVQNESIHDTRFPSLKLKDAIVDKIKEETGERPDSGKERHRIVITLNWYYDKVWIYINTSGRKLSDRGYRKMPHTAPLRETLAASIIRASGYTGETPFINPMCGSGTLAIEAAMLARGNYPQINRDNFCFMHLNGFKPEFYTERRDLSLKSREGVSLPLKPIIASDHDPEAIRSAQINARTAGVEDLIEFIECDFSETPIPEGDRGTIILNPEYGERLGEFSELQSKYRRIGDWLKQSCSGYKGYIFTGNIDLGKQVGLKASRRFEFFNGNIDCRLLKYDLYDGSKR